ncbi:MAG: hypothetical protein ABSF50_19065 [Burkholderiaceae bacterium]
MSPEVSKADARDPNIEFEGEGAPSLAFARPAIYLVCTIVVVALGYALGEDAPWDAFHYHLYAGFSALHDRFDQDFFAAGAQSYFNPYVHVPFYWMVRSGLPGLVISGIFSSMAPPESSF